MFLGSNLLLGSAPAEAQKGDLICLFWDIGVVALPREEHAYQYPVFRVIGKLYLSTGYLRDLKPVYQDTKYLNASTGPPDSHDE
jgi:hypothetical protein